MEPQTAVPALKSPAAPAAIGGERRHLQAVANLVVWLAGNLALAVAVGWIAFQLQQQGFNPIGVVSLLVGAALGLGGAQIARKTGVRSRKLAVPAAVLFGLLTVAGESYLGYRAYQREIDEAESRDPRVALARSAFTELNGSFAEFVSRRAQSDSWWPWALGFDALVTATSAAGVTAWLLAQRPSPKLSTET